MWEGGIPISQANRPEQVMFTQGAANQLVYLHSYRAILNRVRSGELVAPYKTTPERFAAMVYYFMKHDGNLP
jgi:hypothetical protein